MPRLKRSGDSWPKDHDFFCRFHPDERTDDTIILLDPACIVVSNVRSEAYSLSLRSTPFLSLILDLLNSIINYNATALNSVDMTIDLSSRNSLVGDKLDDRSSMHGEGSMQSSLLEFLFTKSKTRGVQSRNGKSRRSIYRCKYVMKLLIRVACELNRNSRRTKRRDD